MIQSALSNLMFQFFPLFIFLIKQLSLLWMKMWGLAELPNCELLTNRKNVEVVWCCSKIMLLLRKVRVIHDYAEENMRRYLSLYDTFTRRKIFSCDQECRVIPLSKIFYSLDLGSFDFILENLKTVKRF